MRSATFLTAVYGLAGCVLLCGCGSDPKARQAVSGTVNFKGKPLDQGRIHFAPADKGPSEAGATIKEGAFSIPRDLGLVPGAYRVSIFSYDQKGPKVQNDDMPGDPGNVQFKERIPSKYNAKTTLTAEVKNSGSNSFEFKLD